MKTLYETLIEHIINDESDKARHVFHKIVVNASRDIYESIMDEEPGCDEVGGNRARGLVREIGAEEDGAGFAEGEDEDFGDELGGDEGDLGGDEFGGDEGDLGDDDLGGDEMGGELGGNDADIGSKIDQLGDTLSAQLADLQAEFERRMSGDSGDEGEDDGESAEFPGSEEDGEEFGGEEGSEEAGEEGSEELAEGEDEELDESEEDTEELEESLLREYAKLAGIREYVENQGEIYKQEPASGEGKVVGQRQDSKPSINAKSIVAGKNDMGGSTANIVKGGSEAAPDGNTPKKPSSYVSKGEKKMSDEQFKNAPGNKKVWDSKKSDAHGTEKKGAGEGKLAGDDGSVPVNSTSLLKRRS